MSGTTFIQVILPLRLDWIPFYRLPQNDGSVRMGDKVKVEFSGRNYIGVISGIFGQLPAGLEESKVKDILGIEDKMARIRPEELRLWMQIADYYMCSIGEVFRTVCPAKKLDREAIEQRKKQRIEMRAEKLREMIERARTENTRARYKAELAAILGIPENSGIPGNSSALRNSGIVLSGEQERAYGEICEAFREKKAVLLDGVTGSGKTEIYMKLAAEVMDEGLNVLYLVPEIALSRQLEQRLEKVFGERLMVFHSHETQARRGRVASLVAERPDGKSYIVLGTRSALFLPHHELGLIIIDEEHDSSYKQDSPAPRYNGRDVAAMMASIQGASLIMGSATPSLESIYNCSTGRYKRVELKERYHGESEVEVEIIDTRAEWRKRGMHGCFSRKLIASISETLAEGRQAMILRERRSYSPAVHCPNCGDIPKCPRCNISLSLHKGPSGERLLCHHCGNSYAWDGKCKICGTEMEGMGAGTQKVWEEACELFPEARIARLDSDVCRSSAEEERIIREFAEGNIDILVGTRILSKGFDFEGLGLVAVIQADALLAAQDFRADEKACQLLEQFKGRCARRGGHGLFIIQCSKPDHPVLGLLQNGGSNDFLVPERRQFGYPPYTRLIVLRLKDRFADRAERCATALIQDIYMALGELGEREVDMGAGVRSRSVSIVGPYMPPRETEDGKHIREVRISLAKTKELVAEKRLIHNAINEYIRKSRYDGEIIIDVDPA